MLDAILVFEDIHLPTPEGRRYAKGLDWQLASGSKITLRSDSETIVSELFRLAAGLVRSSSGNLLLDGAPHPENGLHPFLAKGGLGWVPPNGGLLMNLDVLANLALPLRFVHGLSKSEALERAETALELAGLGALAQHRPHLLEGRDRWLATLVRTQLLKPLLWLVEGPIAPLDRKRQQAARKILNLAIQPAEITVVVVGDGEWMPDGLSRLRLVEGQIMSEATG